MMTDLSDTDDLFGGLRRQDSSEGDAAQLYKTPFLRLNCVATVLTLFG